MEIGRKAKEILDSKLFDEDERPILKAQINEMNKILEERKEALKAGGSGALFAQIRQGTGLKKVAPLKSLAPKKGPRL